MDGHRAAERRASLERASYLNDAYRTLKQPVARIAYLLELEGVWTPADRGPGASNQVPPALLEEVFSLNEELDEIREAREGGAAHEQVAARLDAARTPIAHKQDEHERLVEALSARWDADQSRTTLEALRECLLERTYLRNLLATIDREAATLATA